MSDDDLDDVMSRSAVAPSEEAQATAVLLACQVRDEVAGAIPLGRRWSRGRIAVGTAVAVVALSGAGTLSAYQLSVPPFQTLPEGVGRTTTGIPVNYTNSLGREVECLAFIEYQNLTPDQRAAVEEVARDDVWQGYGQRVLDGLDMPDAHQYQQNEAIFEVVSEDLWEAARTAVPGMVRMKDSGGPVLAGTSMSCAGPGGADGRP